MAAAMITLLILAGVMGAVAKKHRRKVDYDRMSDEEIARMWAERPACSGLGDVYFDGKFYEVRD